MNIIMWWRTCRKLGHNWKVDSPSLGGNWLKCKWCGAIDEEIPGVHMPRGYRPEEWRKK